MRKPQLESQIEVVEGRQQFLLYDPDGSDDEWISCEAVMEATI